MKTFVKLGLSFAALFLSLGYLYHTSHAGGPETQEKVELPILSAEQLVRAKQLFKERCARCHGADGRGQTVLGNMLGAPDFADKAWWRDDISDASLVDAITNGKIEMPAFGKKLSKQKIGSLAAYVRRFSKSDR